MSKVKTVNYTAEQTAELVAAYSAADSDETRAAVVESFAEAFSKKPASIRAKLVREKVYVKPENTGKRNGVKKADLLEEIAEFTGTPAEILDSLNKATMFSLNRIVETFRDMQRNAEELSEELQGNPAE
jgi:hypothetical protein